MTVHEPVNLPPDLEGWGWSMQQLKSGPRKNPGGWWQFIFWRLHGLARGDDRLDLRDESRCVKVRRATHDEAFAEAIMQMRARSALLVKSDDHDRLLGEHQRQWAEHRRIALELLPERGSDQ